MRPKLTPSMSPRSSIKSLLTQPAAGLHDSRTATTYMFYQLPDRVVIGRDKNSDIHLESPRVSVTHAVLERWPAARYSAHDVAAAMSIREQGARNGVYVDGQRLERGDSALVTLCMEIRIAEHIFRAVNGKGEIYIIATTQRGFRRGAGIAYGKKALAAERIGCSYETVRRAMSVNPARCRYMPGVK